MYRTSSTRISRPDHQQMSSSRGVSFLVSLRFRGPQVHVVDIAAGEEPDKQLQ